MGAAKVEVWNRANSSKLADITTSTDNATSLTASLELNALGSFDMELQADHANASSVTAGTCVRLYDGSTLVGTFTIDELEEILVAVDDADKVLKCSGSGLMSRLSQGLVYPWLGNTGRPVSRDRIFNWASPPLDTTSWGGVFLQERVFPLAYLPEAWPNADVFGYYINTRAFVPGGAHPVGDTLFRNSFDVETATNAVFYISADDTFELWLDGILLEREPNKQPDNSGNESTWRYVVYLTAGTHTIAVKLTNWDVSDVSVVNPSAFIFSAWPVSSAGVITGVPFLTSSEDTFDWLGLDYPDPFPGWEAPDILQMLLDECQDRDELLGWTLDVHGTYDEIVEFGCRVGDTFLKVVEALAATYIDVECDPEGLVLHVYPKGTLGTTTSVSLVEGGSLVSLSRTTDDNFSNRIAGVWEEGLVVETDATSVTANGVRPTSVEIGTVADETAAQEILQGYLDAYSEPLVSLTADVVPITGAVAGIDYTIGDIVPTLGPLEDVKTVGLTWTLDEGGELEATPEFDSLLAVRQRDTLRSIQFQVAKFDSPATAQILAPDLKIANGRVNTESQSWSWSGDIDTALSDRDDPDAPWQPWSPTRAMRIYMFEVQIKYEDLADATGDSIFELYINGTLVSGLLNLTLDTTTHEARVWVSPFLGYVLPSDQISVACTTAGNHVDGTVTVRLADPV